MSWQEGSQVFYNIAVGTSAGVFVAVKTVSEFLSSRKKRSLLDTLKKKYSRKKLNKTYKLVDTEREPGRVYLLDFDTKKRHWIASLGTFKDLEYRWDDVTRASDKEFNDYKDGVSFLTSGKPGL